MSYRKQYIEWDVKDFQNSPVGFEIELSQNSVFFPITYHLTTYEESHEHYAARFFYSLDNGITWIDYPYGTGGATFTEPFRMRLELNANNAGGVVVYNGESIYKLTASCGQVLSSFVVDISGLTDTGYGNKSNTLYMAAGSTLYRVKTDPKLEPYDNSLNVSGESLLGVYVDESRGSFWQINRDSVCLKDLNGMELYSVSLGMDIDIDFSSSSSSSSISSDSSSSYGVTSSSSSWGYSSSSSSWGYSSSSSQGESSSSSSQGESSSSSQGESSSSSQGESSSSSSQGESSSSSQGFSSSSSSQGESSSSSQGESSSSS